MSRIGKSPIKVPSGVEISLDPGYVRVKGPKGSLERSLPREILVSRQDDEIIVTRPTDEGPHRALHGLTRTLVANMVQGVTEGFERVLEVHGTGYRAEVKGSSLELQLGYSHPISFPAPEGITFEATPERIPSPHTRIVVRGTDKELVGQVAANIRKLRRPDPYKQKGVRYAGERLRKKAGKTAK